MRYPKRHFYTAFAAFVIVMAAASPPNPLSQGEEGEPHPQPLSQGEGGSLTPNPSPKERGDQQAPIAKPSPQSEGARAGRVWSYRACFPDIQDVQIEAAMAAGIVPVETAEQVDSLVRQQQLVSIYGSPYFAVEPLTHSLPYVVPRALQLLDAIGLRFIDACIDKGLPPHLPVVTSVLRTTEQVARLQRGNSNATTNSCHCYGTTFDIAYTRFHPLTGNPTDSATRWDEPLKLTLAEVLYDLRSDSLVYIKYEHKQACFHMTIRPQ